MPPKRVIPQYKTIRGNTAIARHLANKFGHPVSNQNIYDWSRNADPAFPQPISAHYDYDVEACEKWFQENVESKRITGDALVRESAEAKQRLQIIKAQREQAAYEKEIGKLIERELARSIIVGGLRKMFAFTRAQVEASAPLLRKIKLKDLGASEEIIEAFNAWDITESQAVIDRLHARCEAETKEADALEI